MITKAFLNLVFGFVSLFFSLMPEVTWSVDTSAFRYILDILGFVGYMFPWHTVVEIVSAIISICIFRIVVSFIRTVWALLPFA